MSEAQEVTTVAITVECAICGRPHGLAIWPARVVLHGLSGTCDLPPLVPTGARQP